MNSVFLEDFLKTYRPSGYEKDGAVKFVTSTTLLGKDYKIEFIDKMWNACVSVGSESPDALKILISGHSDQNCLIVTNITKNGFLKYATQGGISPKTVIDSDMYVMTGKNMIPCFCSYKAIHLEKPDDRKKCPEHKDLVLDLGCTSKEQVQALGIHIGDLVVFDNSNLKMNFGTNGDYIVGSGLDDGVACGITFDVLENLNVEELKKKNIRVYGACITSEETGARGVGPVVRKISPDISIDIDVCHDSCKEVGEDEGCENKMGDGVVLNYGPDKYRPLNTLLWDIAGRYGISLQVRAGRAGGTNTNSIQMMSDDCATTLLSIPCRYMHSSTHEMVNKNDINACGKLISKFIQEVNVNEWK